MKLFDLHCDTLYECCETGCRLRENQLMVNQEQAAIYDHYAQVFALFCGAATPQEQAANRHSLLDTPPEKRLGRLLETAKQAFYENADWLTLCLCHDDLVRARAAGKAAAFLSIEGAELLTSPDQLAQAYEAGVRMVGLSWNGRNEYACGAATDNDAVLTARGEALVQEMVDRGMIVDVSHLSEGGFWSLCALTDAPFMASHSNSRACCNHLRNLTDLQFSEIVRRGGLVGLNLYVPFLRQGGGEAQLSDVRRHLEHFLELGGESCLALGCDFDGCDHLPEGIQGLKSLPVLYEELLRYYPQSLVRALFYDNADAFMQRMLQREE